MKRDRTPRSAKHDRLRAETARVAAQLLVEEEVRSYREARSQAVRRLSPGASAERGAHLPDYPEIHAELRRQLLFYGGEPLARRVGEYRRLALKYLELFAPFQPLLVGSVARGEVREISDINLQLFCDKPEEVGYFLADKGLEVEETGDADSARFFFEDEGVEIECLVLPEVERRRQPRCKITGEKLVRIGARQLQEILAARILFHP